jgi:hypothetical protein
MAARITSRKANPGAVARASGGTVPTLNPKGKSGPQGLSGASQVRRLTAAERAAQSMAAADNFHPQADVGRGLQRAGHRFKILTGPDGRIIHQYGSDVAPELRRVVLSAASRAPKRRSQAPQAPPVFHPQ